MVYFRSDILDLGFKSVNFLYTVVNLKVLCIFWFVQLRFCGVFVSDFFFCAEKHSFLKKEQVDIYCIIGFSL